jgi:hypothetical protein
LLITELGKIPEMQDGISESESMALKKLAEYYNLDSDAFDKAFEEMYQEGLPGVRKYCSPLQAFFWLVEDGKLEACNKILNKYTLYDLLLNAWDLQDTLNLPMEQLRIIINTLPQKQQRLYDGVTQRNIANNITSALYKHYQGLLSKESKKLIKDYINHTKYHLRWGNYDTVVERLNSPELLDYYERHVIGYKHRPGYGEGPEEASRVFRNKYGHCAQVTAFTVYILQKAGYEARRYIVANPALRSPKGNYHRACLFIMKGKKYIMDNGRGTPIGIVPFEDYGDSASREEAEKIQWIPMIRTR